MDAEREVHASMFQGSAAPAPSTEPAGEDDLGANVEFF
jgi:hypothetical protein